MVLEINKVQLWIKSNASILTLFTDRDLFPMHGTHIPLRGKNKTYKIYVFWFEDLLKDINLDKLLQYI